MSEANSTPLTQSAVIAAARTLLASGGLPALSMRRIAAKLGVQPSALYWHFDSKQQLLAALANDLLAEVSSPGGSSWQERVASLLHNLRHVLLRYRDGADVVSTALAFGLGGEDLLGQLRQELTVKELNPAVIAPGAAVLLHFTFGYTINEQQHHQAASLGAISPPDPPIFSAEEFDQGVRVIIAGLQTGAV